MKPRSCLIIGCGRFGSRAAEEILRSSPLSEITVVDKSTKALRKVRTLLVRTAVGDGRSFLNRSLSDGLSADFIIPAVPFHFVFEFILGRLKALGARRRKVPALAGLPNPIAGKTGDLYTSFADFLCPEDCPEPAGRCSVTGKRRPKPLYEMLRQLQGFLESRVIRSEQLGPGVGGFRLEGLLSLTKEIEERMTSEPSGLILISTACRCHGVTSALSWKR